MKFRVSDCLAYYGIRLGLLVLGPDVEYMILHNSIQIELNQTHALVSVLVTHRSHI